VVRLSGAGAFGIAARIIPTFRADPPRTAHYAAFRDASGALLDRGIYLVFPGPRSETGEDVVEFQCHGGLSVPARLLATLEAAGARPAHPGEFTRRAVQNGKLDLLQAEAIGDLIDAEAPAQAAAALTQLEGGLSRRLGELRAALIELLALLAYDVDFPDEDDGPVSRDRIESARAAVAAGVERLLGTAPLAERVRRGALVVLAGPPNVGKSSLFNALLGRDRALVTELAGTTRDAIEAHVDFLGWPIRLVDTAGLGETTDRIEALGQEMSRRFQDGADLVVECRDGSAARRLGDSASGVLLAHTKADLGAVAEGIPVSVVTGAGLSDLKRAIVERLFQRGAGFADLEPALTRARHREALTRAREALAQTAEQLRPGGESVLAAHHVQEAVRALDSLVGSVDVEEVLDRVFASFCVGK
jgi:tRNA modification GTPase